MGFFKMEGEVLVNYLTGLALNRNPADLAPE
jgi:hypothetical protein